MSKEAFKQQIEEGYTFKGDVIQIGAAMLEGEVQTGSIVNLPIKMFNRHGLIAGATGTGKTKTVQIIAEQLSQKGIPSMLVDIKGDLSGIAAAGEANPKLSERHEKIGIEAFAPGNSPIEFLTISSEPGVKMRATVHEFGPVLFSKILGLNDTQTGIFSVIFKYCTDNDLQLLDFSDVKAALKYAMSAEGNAEIEQEYGKISASSIGVILRQIAALEEQGAQSFFGEPSFEVYDLMKTRQGQGVVNILRVTDIQSKPKFFSTFMLQLLAELYETLPEEGDLDKPKFVMFIDEAHLIFSDDTPKVLAEQLEVMVRLIRSKGVGIFFITQNPADIDDDVLGQLGLKIQHALRAFTAKDRKAIRAAAQNYPETDFYDVEQLITELGIGEAFVTALSEKGNPTPLAHTYMRAPKSRMGVLEQSEMDAIVNEDVSGLIGKYKEDQDPESAAEKLKAKQEAYAAKAQDEAEAAEREKLAKEQEKIEAKRAKEEAKEEAKSADKKGDIAGKVGSEVGKGLLNAAIGFGLRSMGVKTRRRKFF